MTIEISGTLTDGKNARILHNGNRFPVKTVTASSEVTNYPGFAANAGDTVDRWRPFSNQLDASDELDDTDFWTPTNLTVGTDGQTLTETTDNAAHYISQSYTFTAAEQCIAIKVERQTMPQVIVWATDGTTTGLATFDLRTGTAGAGVNCTSDIVDLGSNQYLCRIYFTTVAAAGVFRIYGADAAGSSTYAGSTDNTIKILDTYIHESEATLRFDLFTAQAGDVVCLAAHNLGTAAARVLIQHDSNEDDTWTTIDTVEPTDNSPIMVLFDAVTSSRWRILVDRGVLPEVGVFRVGAALKMQRPFYGGFAPSPMSRATSVRGNISGSGELLGRTKTRTLLNTNYSWNNLTYAWVRANLDGANGLIQSAETEPLFIAWRPSETQDVDYLMRAQTNPPQNSGPRDLMTFSMSGEAWAYE